jgi:hypothetical protein
VPSPHNNRLPYSVVTEGLLVDYRLYGPSVPAAAHQDWETIELLSATVGSHRRSRCADRPDSPPTVGCPGGSEPGQGDDVGLIIP